MGTSSIRIAAVLTATLFATGCGACAEFATEKALSSAGIDVDLDGQKIKIKGKDGEELELDASNDKGTLTVKGKEGEFKFAAEGDGKVPEGFPIELAKGGKVEGSVTGSTGKEKTFLVTVRYDGGAKRVDELSKYFQEQLEKKGYQVERSSVDTDGSRFVMLNGKAERGGTSVTVSSGAGEDAVTAQISVREEL